MKYAVAGFVRSDGEASGGSRGTGSISGSSAFLFLVRAFSTRGRLLLDDSDSPREEPSAGKPHARICGGEAEWPSYPTIPAQSAFKVSIVGCLMRMSSTCIRPRRIFMYTGSWHSDVGNRDIDIVLGSPRYSIASK